MAQHDVADHLQLWRAKLSCGSHRDRSQPPWAAACMAPARREAESQGRSRHRDRNVSVGETSGRHLEGLGLGGVAAALGQLLQRRLARLLCKLLHHACGRRGHGYIASRVCIPCSSHVCCSSRFSCRHGAAQWHHSAHAPAQEATSWPGPGAHPAQQQQRLCERPLPHPAMRSRASKAPSVQSR